MLMPEERHALAWDPSSSRDATPTVSEEWRTYLWHLSWQRGRHGRGRGPGRRGMKALEIARSIARISVARRRCQRPRGRGHGIIQVPRPEDGGVNEELGLIAVDSPVVRKTCAEIALALGGMEEPVAGEITTDESRLAEGGLEKTEAEIALAQRWLPLRYPDFPKTGKFEDFVKYTNESNRIRELNKPGYDRCKKLPYWEVKHDNETSAAAVQNPKKKDICLKAGESVAAVSSVGPGQDSTTFYCSGVITSCDDDAVGSVRILTSSGILYDNDGELHSPDQKVYVKLANDQKYEGNVLFVNKHYSIALLEVCVGSPMVALSFSTIPQYGQTVTALGRDNMHVFLRDGIISTKERTSSGRNHYMIVESGNASGFPVICAGGPVIDEDGSMIGIITCHIPETAMLPIPIVQICLDMWKNYRCVARPEMNMNLLTVQNLPYEVRDKVQCIYEMRRGFIIDVVEYDSAPEKIGIRKGDVVEILDNNCGSTLPELEIHLLSHGLRFLSKMEGLSTKEVELKIRVHDLVAGSRTDTRVSLPVIYE